MNEEEITALDMQKIRVFEAFAGHRRTGNGLQASASLLKKHDCYGKDLC